MTPEEEIKAAVEAWQVDTVAKAKETIFNLETRIRELKLVELELRGLLADRELRAEEFAGEKARRRIWTEHVAISNACNTRLAEAMEGLTNAILKKLS